MTDAQNAAFYAFCLGVNSLGFLNACLDGNFGFAMFLAAAALLSLVATLAFAMELKTDQRPTDTPCDPND